MEMCVISECERVMEGPRLGMCKSHAQRYRAFGMSKIYCGCGKPYPLTRSAKCLYCDVCRVDGCNKPYTDLGYCARHYMSYWRYGQAVPSIKCASCDRMVGNRNRHTRYCFDCRRAAKRKSSQKSQARRRSVCSEEIDRDLLYLIDHGICYLCQEPVLADYAVDHIIPISRGGNNVWSNIAVTHKICNSQKSCIPVKDLINKFPKLKLPERIGGVINGNK